MPPHLILSASSTLLTDMRFAQPHWTWHRNSFPSQWLPWTCNHMGCTSFWLRPLLRDGVFSLSFKVTDLSLFKLVFDRFLTCHNLWLIRADEIFLRTLYLLRCSRLLFHILNVKWGSDCLVLVIDLWAEEFCIVLVFLPQNVNLWECFILGYLRKLFLVLSTKLLFDSIDSL
jgi:hypothetical protein